MAVYKSLVQIAKMLLDFGADVDVCTKVSTYAYMLVNYLKGKCAATVWKPFNATLFQCEGNNFINVKCIILWQVQS